MMNKATVLEKHNRETTSLKSEPPQSSLNLYEDLWIWINLVVHCFKTEKREV
jgi:hypothetical protein